MAIVGVTVHLKPELLLDFASPPAPVTTKTNGDWTKTARLLGTATTATPTIAHAGGGYYDISFVPSAAGSWSVEYSVLVGTELVYFDPVLVEVLPAAADPAAIADAIAAVQADVTTVKAMTDVATSTRASESVWTAGRAARLDRIGSGVIAVRSVVLSSGTIELTAGIDYTVASGYPIDLVSNGWVDLTGATITLEIIDQVTDTTVLSQAMSIVTPPAPTDDQTLRAELTRTQTATLNAEHTYWYRVIAVLAGNTATLRLARGAVTVLP